MKDLLKQNALLIIQSIDYPFGVYKIKVEEVTETTILFKAIDSPFSNKIRQLTTKFLSDNKIIEDLGFLYEVKDKSSEEPLTINQFIVDNSENMGSTKTRMTMALKEIAKERKYIHEINKIDFQKLRNVGIGSWIQFQTLLEDYNERKK